MLLWFVGVSFAAVWIVFTSPALDYRLVIAGSVLPLVEVFVGEPRVLHSLVAPTALMVVVMVVTRGRRLVRRRWLGVPIGMFLHLLLDGIWTDTEAFWWPFAGGFSDEQLPELARGGWNVVLEVCGLAALLWCVRAFDLREPEHWRRFRATGRLSPGLGR